MQEFLRKSKFSYFVTKSSYFKVILTLKNLCRMFYHHTKKRIERKENNDKIPKD